MGVSLYFSHKLEHLLKQFSTDLNQQKGSVFQPNYVVTQTEGMEKWVSMGIAKENGVFANFSYLKPNDMVLEVARILKVNAHFKMSPNKIKWWLYFLLNENDFVSRFQFVSRYYQGVENSDLRRMQLATKIADLFDQMVIYRQDYIKAWNEEKLVANGDEIEAWQAYLWNKVHQKIEDALDRTQLKDKLLGLLKNDTHLQQLVKQKFPVISVFGLSVLTEYHIEFFHELAQYIEVRFYFLNPAPEVYWYDCKSVKELQKWSARYRNFRPETFSVGNDLLMSWGKLGQQLFSAFLDKDELVNGLAILEHKEQDPKTLLQLIQQEINLNLAPTERNSIAKTLLQDGTLQIHSCHSPAREVEVLYNFLVKTMSENTHLAPHDILVMMPNVEAYAPYVQSIFDNAPYKISYSIADRELSQSEDFVAVLLSLLELNNHEFTSEKILRLLDHKRVATKFGITDPNLIRRVVNEVNIRFGWDTPKDATETYLVSWQAGLERIVLGIAMKGADMYEFEQEQVLSYDALEGADAFELLRFISFVKTIQQLIQDGKRDRNLAEWQKYIQLIGETFLGSETDNEGVKVVLTQLDYLVDVEGVAEANIPRAVFVQSVSGLLGNSTSSSGYLKGNVTFCSTVPMRSIPFKVVAFLGMNSEDFPRQDSVLGFDLIAQKPRKGDRSLKLNDKYLFLEAMLSAEEFFYMSYVGKSIKDNTPKEPSILIEDLLNYLQQQSDQKVSELLVTQHPLHGFSAKYNTAENAGLYTYFPFKDLNTGVALLASPLQKNEAEESENKTISLYQLQNAVTKPIKFYFNNRLKIYFENDSLLVPETEIFSLNKLDEWNFKNYLLKNEIDEEFIRKQKQAGHLPLANIGFLSLDELKTKIDTFRIQYADLINEYTEDIREGVLVLDDLSLHFDIPVFVKEKEIRQVDVCFSKNVVEYGLKSWIKHLVLVASGIEVKTYFLSNENNYECHFNDQSRALEILLELKKFYIEAKLKIKPIVHQDFFNEWSKGAEKLSIEKLSNLVNSHSDDQYFQTFCNLNGVETEMNESIFTDLEVLYQPFKDAFYK